jgi:hypothetical protein
MSDTQAQEQPSFIDLANITIRQVLFRDFKVSPERFLGKHVVVPRHYSPLWKHGIFVHDRYNNPRGLEVMDMDGGRGLGLTPIDFYSTLTYEGDTLVVVDYPSEATEATMRRVDALYRYNRDVAPFSYHVEDPNREVFPTICKTVSGEVYAGW